MKRLFKILFLIITSILVLGSLKKVEASNFNLNTIVDNTKVKAGEIVTIDLKISNINAGKEGINVLEGILEYDDSIFDSIKIECKNDWNAIINTESGERKGKFLAVKMVEGVTQEEEIGQIQLQSKDGINEVETEIKIKDIKSNNGKETIIDKENKDIEIKVIQPTINIDTDGDGKPDINIDTDGDGKPDINIDTDGDGKPDINIDTDGDGKPDINIDTDGDGKPDTNLDTDKNQNNKQPVEKIYISDEEKDYPYKGKGSIIADGVKTGDVILLIVIAAIVIILANIIYFTIKRNKLKEQGKTKSKKSIIIAVIISIILMGIVIFLAKDVIARDNIYIQEMIERLKKENEDNPGSTNYLVTDTIISRIKPETTVGLLKEKIENVTVNIEKNGVLKEVQDKTEKLKTGMIIKYAENDKKYETSVLGDINKDGELNQIELTKEIRECLEIENWRITDELERISADVTCDGKIDEKDIESMMMYIVFGELETEKVEEIKGPQIQILQGNETDVSGWYNSNVKIKISEEKDKTKTTKTIYKITGTKEQKETEIENEAEIELTEEGVYKITAYTYGPLGNKSKGTTAIIVINDKIGIPTINVNPIEWTNENVEVSITSNISRYGIEYRINEGEWTTYQNKLQIPQNCKIEARITDGKNYGTIIEKEIANIDKIMPIGKIEALGVSASKVSLQIEGQDEQLSGIREIKVYAKEENSQIYECKETIEYEQDETEHNKKIEEIIVNNLKAGTTYKMFLEVTDNAGNVLRPSTINDGENGPEDNTEVTTPEDTDRNLLITVTTETIGKPIILVDKIEWTNEDVQVTIEGEEKFITEYKINNGEWQKYIDKFVVQENCRIATRLKEIDGNNYSEEVSRGITNIDKEMPTGVITKGYIKSDEINLNISSQDASLSGIKKTRIYVNDIETPIKEYIYEQSEDYTLKQETYKLEGLTANTTYTIYIEVEDNAGNIYSTAENMLEITTLPESTLEIESRPTKWIKGNAIATITAPDRYAEEGYVIEYQLSKEEITDETESGWIIYDAENKITVEENTIIYARLTKTVDNTTKINEKIVKKEITNIDKELPTGSIEKILVSSKQAQLKLIGQDQKLSGIKAIRVYVDDEETARKEYNYNVEEDYILKEEIYNLEGLEVNTTYNIYIEVEDYVGNIYSTKENKLEITTLPEATLDIQVEPTDWTNKDVKATIIAPERYIQEGYTVEYQLSKEEVTNETEKGWINYDAENKITIEENTILYTRLTKTLENSTKINEKIVKKEITNIDKTNPTVNIEMTSKTNTIIVNANATDEESGLAENTEYAFYIKKSDEEDSSYIEKQKGKENNYTFTELDQNVDYTIKVTINDKAGNIGEITKSIITGSIEKPEEAIYTPTSWTSQEVRVILPTKEGYDTIYTMNGTEPTLESTAYTMPFIVNSNCTIKYKYSDGNNLSKESTILNIANIDKELPTGAIEKDYITSNEINLNITGQDEELSGIQSIKIFVNNEETPRKEYTYNQEKDYTLKREKYKLQGLTANTSYMIYIEVKDNAGNIYSNSKKQLEITTLPEATLDIQAETTDWTNKDVVATITAPERYIEEGYTIEYQLSKEEITDETENGWITYDAESKITVEKNRIIYARLTKTLQNGEKIKEKINSKEITNIDKISPTINIESTSTENTILAIARATDEESGLAENAEYVFYIKKAEETDSSYVEKQRGINKSYTFTKLEQNTSYIIKVVTTDKVGNLGISTKEIQTGTVEKPGEGSYTPTEWTKGDVTVTLPTKEGFKTVYTIDGTTPTATSREYTLPFGVSSNCIVRFRYSDGNNLSEEGIAINVENIDKELPSKPILTNSSNEDWTNQNITINATATDNDSGIQKFQYSYNETDWLEWNNSTIEDITNGKKITHILTEEENSTLYIRAVDNAGNYSLSSSTTIKIDRTAPTVNIDATSTINTITANTSATDLASGVPEDAEYIFYIKKTEEADDSYVEKQRGTEKNHTFTELEQNTSYTVKVTTLDQAGNEGKITKEVQTGIIEIPEDGSYTPTEWTKEVTVTLPTKGGFKTLYTIDGTEPTLESTEYTSPFIVSNNCVVKYKYSDGINSSITSATLNIENIDTLSPNSFTPEATSTENSITIKASATDQSETSTSACSGIEGYKFKLNDNEWTDYQESGEYTFNDLDKNTNYTIAVEAKDKAGNTTVGKVLIVKTKNTHTITFDANGGEDGPSSQTKVEGKDITLTDEIPTRLGYTFKGWATSANDKIPNYNAGQTIDTSHITDIDHTFYAVWWENVAFYNITTEEDGRTVELTASEGECKENKIIAMIPANCTVSVKAKCSLEGGSGEVKITADLGDRMPIYTKDFTFTTTEEGIVELIPYVGTGSGATATAMMEIESIINNATEEHYQPTAGECRIHYSANGGSNQPLEQIKTQGEDLKLRDTIPTRNGYTFKGWGTSSNATSVSYEPGAIYSGNKDITLYAIWWENIAFQNYTTGGDGTSVTSTASNGSTEGNSVYVMIPADCTVSVKVKSSIEGSGDATVYTNISTNSSNRSDFTFRTQQEETFVSFNIVAEASSGSTAEVSMEIESIVNKTGKHYQPVKGDYHITYDTNGGSGFTSPSIQCKSADANLKLTSKKPTREGYTFKGWATSASDPVETYKAGGTFTGNCNMTLYAVWWKNVAFYNITTEGDGRSIYIGKTTTLSGDGLSNYSYAIIPANCTVSVTASCAVTGGSGSAYIQVDLGNAINTYTQDFTFTTTEEKLVEFRVSVEVEKGATATAGMEIRSIVNSKTFEHFQPTAGECIIEYNANGGSNPPLDQIKTQGEKLKLSNTKPTRSGYEFLGWSTNKNATTATYKAGESYTGSSDLKLYAIWSHPIEFSNGTRLHVEELGTGTSAYRKSEETEATIPAGYTVTLKLSDVSAHNGGFVFVIYKGHDHSYGYKSGTNLFNSSTGLYSFTTTEEDIYTFYINAGCESSNGSHAVCTLEILEITDEKGVKCTLK